MRPACGEIRAHLRFQYPPPRQRRQCAFETAPHLKNYVNGLSGEKIIMAYSLGYQKSAKGKSMTKPDRDFEAVRMHGARSGIPRRSGNRNMVVSSAIADHGMGVSKYFMLNAAVPAEAYDSSLWSTTVSGNNMVHEDWSDYLPRTWSALYYQLFAPNVVFGDDDRHTLTWKGRFTDCLLGLYNYYSSGDEIFEQYDGTPDPEEGVTFHFGVPVVTGTERYSWQKQELYKGRDGMGEFAGLFGTDCAGWGFELVSLMGEPPHPVFTAAEANGFPASDLADPLCASFRRQPVSMFAPSVSETARSFLLAEAIPALSGATGNREIRIDDNDVVNVDMNAAHWRNVWPRTGGEYGTRWLHSDIKDIAYFYTAPLFDDVVQKGQLK